MADDSAEDLDLLQGTLDVLILKTLAWGPENDRRAKYHQLTTLGRRQLRAKATTWARCSAAVSQVLRVA